MRLPAYVRGANWPRVPFPAVRRPGPLEL